MKKQLTRVLLVLLSLVLCFGLYACANPDDDGTNNGSQNEGDEGPDEEKEPEVLPDVEKKDYNYTLNVMHWMVGESPEGWCPWNEICPADGVTGPIGDIIEDKIFDRTGWVKETYGITVTNSYISHDKIPTTITNLLTSGTDEYQVLVDFGYNAQRSMGKNYFLDLRVVDNIDLYKPWWVEESVEQLAMGDFVEFAASDMLVLDKGATSLVFYNIPMAEDLGLNSFYELVDSGDWTLEELIAAAEQAYIDDGNDQRDELDTYGIVCGDDPVLQLYKGAGLNIIAKDSNDEYYYSYGTDSETLETMTVILEDVMYADFYWNTWLTRNDISSENQPSFKKGQSLFDFSMAKGCNSHRDMEADYGILPIPKYDSEQEQYSSWVHSYHDSLIAIFNTAGDPAAVGAALEVMGYYSYYNIYPSFYEVVIQGRGTRDDESRDILDLIFSTRTYDLGLVYDPQSFSDKVLRFTHTGGSDLASFMGEWESKLNTAIDDLNDLASTYW